MFCKQCGNQMPDNAQFCDKCGNPSGVGPVNTPPPNQNYNQQPMYNQNMPPMQVKNKKPAWLIAIFIVLGLFVVGFIALVIGIMVDEDTTTSSSASTSVSKGVVSMENGKLARSVDKTTMKPIDEVNGFSVGEKALYYTCYVNKAPEGTLFTFEWYYNGVKQLETPLVLDEDFKKRYVASSMTLESGFPAGSYEVKLIATKDNEKVAEQKTSFEIK